jgi:hypothetical protein
MATVKSVPNDVALEVQQLQANAATLLNVNMTDPAKDIVTTITEWTRAQKDAKSMPDDDTIVALGVLLGEQYVRAFGWHWGEVTWDDDPDNSSTCVLSPNNSLSINPIGWVNAVYKERNSTNFLLNFNMVAAGKLPNAAANQAMSFH